MRLIPAYCHVNDNPDKPPEAHQQALIFVSWTALHQKQKAKSVHYTCADEDSWRRPRTLFRLFIISSQPVSSALELHRRCRKPTRKFAAARNTDFGQLENQMLPRLSLHPPKESGDERRGLIRLSAFTWYSSGDLLVEYLLMTAEEHAAAVTIVRPYIALLNLLLLNSAFALGPSIGVFVLAMMLACCFSVLLKSHSDKLLPALDMNSAVSFEQVLFILSPSNGSLNLVVIGVHVPMAIYDNIQ
jgi:hypothetical protein